MLFIRFNTVYLYSYFCLCIMPEKKGNRKLPGVAINVILFKDFQIMVLLIFTFPCIHERF